jgi:hypothetical protein
MKYFSSQDIIKASGLNSLDNGLPREDEVKLCEIWIKMYLVKSKNINKKLGSSYHLKHIVEHFGQALAHNGIQLRGLGYITYVSNGAFIQAMKNNGYCYSDPHNTINPYFNAKYNGPYLFDYYLKDIPNSSDQWDKLLSPLLSMISIE